MVDLNTYFERNPNSVNSAIPVYFRQSNYQLRGIEQARSGTDAHYNTHMMRYVGSTSVPFTAYDVGEVHPDGTLTPFGGDKKRIEKELSNTKGMLSGEKITYENQRKTLLEYAKNEFPKHTFMIDQKLLEYSKGGKTEAEREVLKKEMESLFDSGDIGLIQTKLSKIIHWPVTPEDARLLVYWQKSKQKVSAGLKRIEEILENKKPEEYPSFSSEEYNALFTVSKKISSVLTTYNTAVKRVNSLQEQVVLIKKKGEDSKNEEKTREKNQKEAQIQITKLTPELQKAKTEHEKVKQILLASLDE
jgi:hypothetical protein